MGKCLNLILFVNSKFDHSFKLFTHIRKKKNEKKESAVF